MPYLSYVLLPEEKQKLLKKYPPRYPVVRYDHLTIQMCDAQTTLPKPAQSVQIVGMADDGKGLQVFLAKVNGSMIRSSQKGFWHITASYDSTKFAPSIFDYKSPQGQQKEKLYRSETSNGFLGQILDDSGNLKSLQSVDWSVQIFDVPLNIKTTVQKKWTSHELKNQKSEKVL